MLKTLVDWVPPLLKDLLGPFLTSLALMVQFMLYGFRAAMGCTAFLAEPMPRPGDSMGGPAGAGVGLHPGASFPTMH